MGKRGARWVSSALVAALTTFLFSASGCVGDDAKTGTSSPVDGGGTSETGSPGNEGGADSATDGATESGVDAGTPGEVLWSSGFGALGTEQVFGLAIDSKNDIILVGAFDSASVDVGCANPLTRNATGATNDDAFVVKLDPNGKCLWAKSFGGDLRDQAYGVAVDAADAVYVVGATNSNPISFAGTSVTTSGDYDGFIAKLDAAGTVVTARAYGGAGTDNISGITVSSTGQVVATGTRMKPAGAGAMMFGSVTLEAADDAAPQSYAFVAAFTTSINPIWARTIRGPSGLGGTAGFQVATDTLGNVVVSGTVSGSLQPARYPTLTTTIGSSIGDGSSDMFVMKLDGAGTQQTSWAKVFGGPDDEEPAGLALDGAGNVYFTAPYSVSQSFGGAALPAPGSTEIAFAKYQPGGAHLVSKSFSTADQELPGGIAVGAGGGYVMVGAQRAPFDFGNGPTTNNGLYDAFVVAFDADGKARWTRTFGGAGDDFARLVAIRGSTVVVAGRYESNIAIGGKALAFSGGADIYVVKLTY